MTELNAEKIVANMLCDLVARYAAKPESPAETTPEKSEKTFYKQFLSSAVRTILTLGGGIQ